MASSLKLHTPIDAVIAWVDISDTKHQKKIQSFLPNHNLPITPKKNAIGKNTEEVKHTVHSILKYAPFIQHIYIVTDQQIPYFLKSNMHPSYSKIKLVNHKAIFKEDASFLPTFNSISIETKLYQIPGLSEHFIYFNDDVLLLRKTTESDFFIDGIPVLRGKWKKFKENTLYKKLAFKKQTKRPGYVLAQEKSAKIIGFNRLFKFHHTPHPMRRSTLKSFFLKNRHLELNNIKHKFLSNEQFITQGLANHIELKNNTVSIIPDYQLIHFRHYKKPFFWLKFKLQYLSNKKNKLFLNLQDLNSCPKNKWIYIMTWLEKKYGM